MRIIKLAFLLSFFYSCFSYSHPETHSAYHNTYGTCPETTTTGGSIHTYVHNVISGSIRICHYDGFSSPSDCPPVGPVQDAHIADSSGPIKNGNTYIINDCEYTVVARSGLLVALNDGSYSGTVSLDSTGRSSDDVSSSGDDMPPEATVSGDVSFTPTPRDDSHPTEPSTAVTSESSSSITNSDGSTTGSGTVSTITYNDDGTTTETTTTTVTNTSSSGATTGSTTTETSTTYNPNGASTTSTTVTETDGDGVSRVVSQSSQSNNDVTDEEGGSISGGKSCSAPPSRSGDVTDAEYNQILQTYYLRCPPDAPDLVSYKPTGFDKDSLESKVAQAEQEYTDFINNIKTQADSLFSISLNSTGYINKNIVSMRGADVDFSLFRFISELSIIGTLIIALAYIRAFFIITSGEK